MEELEHLKTIFVRAVVYSSRLQSDIRGDREDEYDATSLVDSRDARTVLRICLPRMTISAQASFPSVFIKMMNAILRKEEILCISDLMPSLIETSCSWIWDKLEAAARSSNYPSEDKELIECGILTFYIIGYVCEMVERIVTPHC